MKSFVNKVSIFFAEKTDTFFPFLNWIKKVNRKTIGGDILAGLAGAIIVLPQGVAFATIAGLPPEYGLYSAIVPAIIAALWGSSRHLVSGPTTAISLVVFSTVGQLANPGSSDYVQLVLTLSFLVGFIQLLMGWLKFGSLLSFISHTVVVGFTAGAGILIISSQFKNFFGVTIPQGSSFYETIHLFLEKTGEINPYVTFLAGFTLLLGVVVKKVWPKIPYMIPVMLVGSVVGFFLNDFYSFGITGIKTVGALPATLPPISHPSLDFETVRKLASPALAITLLALIEAVAIAKAIALRSGQTINGNQEFVGQGLANIVGSFFSAYPSSGSFNRSGLNYESGAKTQMSSIFAAIFLGIIILFVASLAAYLPLPVMAAILFLVAWGLIDFQHIKEIIHSSRSETILLAITFLSTLFVELEFSIFVGVFASIALYLQKSSKPTIENYLPDLRHPNRKFSATANTPQCEQLKVVRISGALFFGSIENIHHFLREQEEENPRQKKILIVCSSVSLVDLVGANMLAQYAQARRKRGGDLYLSNVNAKVMRALKKTGALKIIGEEHIFSSKNEAVNLILSRLDKDICKNCTVKIFKEC